MQSWREIFNNATHMHFEIVHHNHLQTAQLAIHSVAERIHTAEAEGQTAVMLATNVYELTSRGWRMILHHASPMRGVEPATATGLHDSTLH